MANKTKITLEMAERIKMLINSGHNARAIAQEFGIAKDTVKLFAKKAGLIISKRTQSTTLIKRELFMKRLEGCLHLKELQDDLHVSYDNARKWALEAGREDLIRTRSESAQDKVLDDSKVISRIPDKSSYIGFNKTSGMYDFVCITTGKIFSKKADKIFQGSPYGKSGHILTETAFKERLGVIGYKLKGDFKGSNYPATFICSIGHERTLNKADWVFRLNCPDCADWGTSNQEKDLLSFVRQYYPNADKIRMPPASGKGKGLEIDVYIPELKLGFEYCGLYWHSDEVESTEPIDTQKHYRKMEIAQLNGIELVTIFSDEWLRKGNQIRSFLTAKMHKNQIRISGRKTKIVTLQPDEAKGFLDENHIQGSESFSNIYLGLKFNNETIAVMALGPNFRGSDRDISLFINRLAFKSGVYIIGGAEKLLKEAKKHATRLGKVKLVSWSDNRWTAGGIYRRLGFKLTPPTRSSGKRMGLKDGSVWPDFFYVYGAKRMSRNEANKMIENGKIDKSNLRMIHDCGKKRWEYAL